MNPKQKQIFEKILSLINSNNFPFALTEINKLDDNSRERFNVYLGNMTLHTESSRFRGRVVEMSIYIELILANFLSQYFGSDQKKELLNSMVFDRMDLQKKLIIVKNIVKTQHVKIWRNETSNLKKIDKLISFRNNIAHSVLNSSPDYIDKMRRKVEQMTSEGKLAYHLDEIEFGFYENHKWLFRAIKWTEIEEYHKGIYDAVNKIEEIGKQIIPNYESTVKN